jgi:hypothetical protein
MARWRYRRARRYYPSGKMAISRQSSNYYRSPYYRYRKHCPMEVKNNDVTINWTNVDNTVPGTNLNWHTVAINEGTGPNNRIGRLIFVKSMELRFTFIHEPEEVTSTTNMEAYTVVFRVMLDKQPNGAVETDAWFGFENPGNIHSFNDLDKKRKYKTLRRKVITLNPNMGGWDGTNQHIGSTKVQYKTMIKFKGKGLKVLYSGTDSDPTVLPFNNIISNAIYVTAVSDQSQGNCTVKGKIRMRFTDS